MKKLWEVTVQADDADLPVVQLPVFAKTHKGALKQALKIIKKLAQENSKPCASCAMASRIQGSVRCQECTDLFGYDDD